jgi:hypothetical protein
MLRVPGALPGREALDLEIFGMAGVPEDAGQEDRPEGPEGKASGFFRWKSRRAFRSSHCVD